MSFSGFVPPLSLSSPQYSDISIPEILDTTRPYAELSVDTLHREEIRIKVCIYLISLLIQYKH